MVRREYVVALRKPRQERLPPWQTAGAMQEQHGLAGAAAPHEGPAVAHRYESFCGIGHGSSCARTVLAISKSYQTADFAVQDAVERIGYRTRVHPLPSQRRGTTASSRDTPIPRAQAEIGREIADQHHFAERLGGDQPDQAAGGIDDADRRRRFLLQDA